MTANAAQQSFIAAKRRTVPDPTPAVGSWREQTSGDDSFGSDGNSPRHCYPWPRSACIRYLKRMVSAMHAPLELVIDVDWHTFPRIASRDIIPMFRRGSPGDTFIHYTAPL
jgi:hypothetical protein